MTRFARAAGSKANNAKVIEDATSWSDMKKQLLESQDSATTNTEVQDKIKKVKAAKKEDVKKESEWAEFGSDKLLKPDYLEPNGGENDKTVEKKKKKKKSKVAEAQDQQSACNDVAEPATDQPKEKTKKKKLKNGQQGGNVAAKPAAPAKPQQQQAKKRRAEKQQEGTEAKRRKPQTNVIYVDGREIEIENYDGFPVLKEDAARLRELRSKMLKEGIPKPEVNKAMKLERRRAEKAFSREKRKMCYHCRQPGHMMSECPQMNTGTCDVCFKCGSTEHKSPQCKVTQGNDYKFGTCFVCGETGHISRQCPDNPRGLYPQGGGCRVCGDVTHLKKDCPELSKERQGNTMTLPSARNFDELESLGESNHKKPVSIEAPKKNKVIKF